MDIYSAPGLLSPAALTFVLLLRRLVVLLLLLGRLGRLLLRSWQPALKRQTSAFLFLRLRDLINVRYQLVTDLCKIILPNPIESADTAGEACPSRRHHKPALRRG